MREVGKSEGALAYFPVMLFAVTMGFGGLGLAYRKLAELLTLPDTVFELLKYTDTVLFIVIAFFYLLKLIRYPKAVKTELNHPIKVNFYGGATVSVFLLGYLWNNEVLFYIALVLQTLLTFYILSIWIKKEQEIVNLNPAWFIPVMGNLIAPVVGKPGVLMWYYFSLGLFFWLILSAIVFYRLFFSEALAAKFTPTLFILAAPPAIMFIGYIKMVGVMDVFALILLNLTLCFVGLLGFMAKHFIGLKFALSWWAFTFPSAAVSIAFFRAYELTAIEYYLWLGLVSFVLLVWFIIVNSIKTVKVVRNGHLFRPE